MMPRSHRELIVWQKAMDMAVQVYAISKRFPDQERFALVSQRHAQALQSPLTLQKATPEAQQKSMHISWQ